MSAPAEDADGGEVATATVTATVPRWRKVLVFAVLPAIALVLAGLAGFVKWDDSTRRAGEIAAIESVAAARDTTAVILSYTAEAADTELNGARDRLTGPFLEEYTTLINEVVIPGAREKKISSVARVPAASAITATPDHAVTLVFVNQTVTVGKDTPTNTASSVRVTLDKVNGRWLVSGFEPV